MVEAAFRSGSLTTLNWADRLSRVTMGVPGPVSSATSGGVHLAIRKGAALVTSGAEVLELIGAAGAHLVDEPRGPVHPRDALSVHDRQVLDAVPVRTDAAVASIANVAGLAPAGVGAALTRLAAAGLVVGGHGGWRLAERVPGPGSSDS